VSKGYHLKHGQRLDLTSPKDREEIAAAFGAVAAWRAAVETYKAREARETDLRRKRKLRLMLLNAENQLRLATEA
jgi:hypothetical protein